MDTSADTWSMMISIFLLQMRVCEGCIEYRSVSHICDLRIR